MMGGCWDRRKQSIIVGQDSALKIIYQPSNSWKRQESNPGLGKLKTSVLANLPQYPTPSPLSTSNRLSNK